jgi:hypothetical protein
VKIAGRCECGLLLKLAARNPLDHALCATGAEQPDPFCSCGGRLPRNPRHFGKHMRCMGLRHCGVCGDVARIGKNCPSCANGYRLKYRLTHGRSERQKASQRARNNRWEERQRRQGTAYYLRRKAALREKYATDPAYAEAKRAAARAYKAAAASSRRKSAESPQNKGVCVSGLRELVNLPFGRRPSLGVA